MIVSISRRGSRAPSGPTPYTIRIDHDFEGVLDGCAEPAPGRTNTWINARIRTLYRKLYDIGHCHSVEAYEDGKLVGGLYGVNLGYAFFGESMFHRARDASKIALVHLVARLRMGGFKLLDTQYVTDHLKNLRRDRSARGGSTASSWKRPSSAKPMSPRSPARRRSRAPKRSRTPSHKSVSARGGGAGGCACVRAGGRGADAAGYAAAVASSRAGSRR